MNVSDTVYTVTHANPTGVKEKDEQMLQIFLLIVVIFLTNKKKKVNVRENNFFVLFKEKRGRSHISDV
jgi:hypothetical protein